MFAEQLKKKETYLPKSGFIARETSTSSKLYSKVHVGDIWRHSKLSDSYNFYNWTLFCLCCCVIKCRWGLDQFSQIYCGGACTILPTSESEKIALRGFRISLTSVFWAPFLSKYDVPTPLYDPKITLFHWSTPLDFRISMYLCENSPLDFFLSRA